MIRLFCLTAIAVSGAVGAIVFFAPRPSLPQIKTEEDQDIRLMLVERIQSQSKLISATGTFSNQIDLSKKRSFWGIPLGSQSLTYQAVGEVSLGYDLSKLNPESVQWIESEGAIAITLPPLEIISVTVDSQQSRPLTSQSISPEMVQQALRVGEASFRAIICATETPTTAREQARSDVAGWLTALEGEGIKVRVNEESGGVCEEAIAQDVSAATAEYPVLNQPLGTYYVSQEFKPLVHDGADVAMPMGSPLFMIGSATSTVVCNESNTGWGIHAQVYIAEYGKSFLLAHLSECYPGEAAPGEVFALSGNTGRSTGPHLHLEQFTGEKSGYAARPEPPELQYLKDFIGVTDSLQMSL